VYGTIFLDWTYPTRGNGGVSKQNPVSHKDAWFFNKSSKIFLIFLSILISKVYYNRARNAYAPSIAGTLPD
jgi:hypothetical protein